MVETLKPERPASEVMPHVSLLTVQALFGSLPVIGKIVLAVLPAVSLVGLRIGITALALVVIQAYRRRVWLSQKGDYWRLAVLSIFGISLNQLLFIGGLSLTKAANTSLLAVTIPVFTLLVSAVLGTERLRGRKLLGVALAAAGVIFLIDPRKASFSSDTTIGDMMIILNSLSYGIYVATSKEVITRNGAFRSMMWVFVFASIICVPLGAYTLAPVGLASIDTSIWGLVLYVALAATAGPYLLNAYAISKVSPSTVAVYVYLQPLIGFGLAVVFLNERLGINFVIAAVCVFAGVYLTTRQKPLRRGRSSRIGRETTEQPDA